MATTVDIRQMVEQESYVVYYAKAYRKLDSAISEYFDKKYTYEMSQMYTKLYSGQKDSFDKMNTSGSGAYQLLQDLSSDSDYSLRLIMNEIADKLNQMMEDKLRSSKIESLDTLIENSRKIFSESYTGDFTEINTFCYNVSQAMKLINEDPNTLQPALNAFFGVFTKQQGYDSGAFAITQSMSTTMKEVISCLNNAAAKFSGFEKKKELTKSMGGTISNLFSKSVGEVYLTNFVQNNLSKAVIDSINYLEEQAKSQARVTGNTVTSTAVGLSKKAESNAQGKVDILSSNILSMSVDDSQENKFTVNLSTNASVKWGISPDINLVNGTTIRVIAKDYDSKGLGYLYNAIAHKDLKGISGMSSVRKGVAASFFVQWLTGSGTPLSGASGTDRVQFLVVNGKIYSVYDIVDRVVQSEAQGNNAISFTSSKLKNEWKGESKIRDWDLARLRSNATREAINKISVSGTLNKSNIGLT